MSIVDDTVGPFVICISLKPSLILLDSNPLPKEKQLYQFKPVSKLLSTTGLITNFVLNPPVSLGGLPCELPGSGT